MEQLNGRLDAAKSAFTEGSGNAYLAAESAYGVEQKLMGMATLLQQALGMRPAPESFGNTGDVNNVTQVGAAAAEILAGAHGELTDVTKGTHNVDLIAAHDHSTFAIQDLEAASRIAPEEFATSVDDLFARLGSVYEDARRLASHRFREYGVKLGSAAIAANRSAECIQAFQERSGIQSQ